MCAWVWYCYVTGLHAYDFVIKDFVIKKQALFVLYPIRLTQHEQRIYAQNFKMLMK